MHRARSGDAGSPRGNDDRNPSKTTLLELEPCPDPWIFVGSKWDRSATSKSNAKGNSHQRAQIHKNSRNRLLCFLEDMMLLCSLHRTHWGVGRYGSPKNYADAARDG